jgi:hypothetical protein
MTLTQRTRGPVPLLSTADMQSLLAAACCVAPTCWCSTPPAHPNNMLAAQSLKVFGVVEKHCTL